MTGPKPQNDRQTGRLLLAIFGFYGIIVACLEGLKPFIEVSKIIAWISQKWVEWTRVFWRTLSELIGLSIPDWIADMLTGVAYCLSVILGMRRVREFGYGGLLWAIRQARPAFVFIEEKCSARYLAPVRFALYIPLGMVLFLPFGIVFLAMMSGSDAIAWSFLATSVLLAYLPGILPARYQEVLNTWLVGKASIAAESIAEDDVVVLAYGAVPFYVLIFLSCILLINEIALRGDNIVAWLDWVRCEAGSQCKADPPSS